MKQKYITISRAGYNLGETKTRSSYTQIAYSEGKARVISPQLAIYQYEKGTDYYGARYHIIHIRTGLVIADVERSDIKHVKKSFESEQWTFKSGDYNTLHLIPRYKSSLRFSITCKIRYDVKEEMQDD